MNYKYDDLGTQAFTVPLWECGFHNGSLATTTKPVLYPEPLGGAVGHTMWACNA